VSARQTPVELLTTLTDMAEAAYAAIAESFVRSLEYPHADERVIADHEDVLKLVEAACDALARAADEADVRNLAWVAVFDPDIAAEDRAETRRLA
jgi:hypothetical protein